MLLTVAVCLASSFGFADDVLITKNSQKINAKIEEVGLDVIKYRRSDNPTGPLYTISKKEIASVLYDNGTVEVFQTEQSLPVQTHNFDAKTAYEQYKNTQLIDAGWSCFAIGNAVFWLCGISWIENYAAGLSMSVIGGATMIASIPMLCVGYSKRKKSDIYNRNYNPDISYNITTGKDGLGFAINF